MYLWLMVASTVMMEIPAHMAETQKSSGKSGLYQRGCSLSTAIRKKVPSDDWCRVEMEAAATTSGISMVLRSLRGTW